METKLACQLDARLRVKALKCNSALQIATLPDAPVDRALSALIAAGEHDRFGRRMTEGFGG